MNQLVQTPLWNHQQEIVSDFSAEPTIILGWDMGTGKTLAAIERDLRLRADTGHIERTLVIAPLATHLQWLEAFALEAPHLTVRVVDPKDRPAFFRPPYCDVYIVHWQAVRLMPKLREAFSHIICDEVHAIKNRKAAVTKATKKLRIPYITDMSGSPATDRPADLWSILNHVKPRTWRSYHQFFDENVDWSWIYVDGEPRYKKAGGPSDRWLNEGLPSIQTYYSRVEAPDVLDLPPKTYNKIYVELDPIQRRAYQEMEEEMISWLEGFDGDLMPLVAGAVIAKLIRLQQFALGYMRWDEERDNFQMSLPAPKLEAVFDLLDVAEQETFLIWSQFKGPLVLLSRMLTKRGISWAMYTGDQSQEQRQQSKAAFMRGDVQVLLATIKAAGTGTDGLQNNCRHMIFLDRDWSPMQNKQAESRLWRGGQERPIEIHTIMAKDTVDFPRDVTIETKKEWVMKALGGKYG